MSENDLVKKFQALYPGWDVFFDAGEGVLHVHAPEELSKDFGLAMAEAWHHSLAQMDAAAMSRCTFTVMLTDGYTLEVATVIAGKYGLMLVPTDDEKAYRVVLAESD